MQVDLTQIKDRNVFQAVLEFLPYPFLIAEEQDATLHTIYANQKFIDEIGYTCAEIPTIDDWFNVAYPDSDYRQKISAGWKSMLNAGKESGNNSATMNVVIQTKSRGKLWYEVKSSIDRPFNFVAFVNIEEIMVRERRLEELTENQNKILSILAHDVRTPVSNLFTLSQFILNGDMSMAEFLTKIEIVYQKSSQVLDFIDTTLLWTKTNFDKLKIKAEEIVLDELVKEILVLYEGNYSSKNLVISIPAKTAQTVICDRNVVTVVLRNLISNAIKFTPDKGRIEIHLDGAGSSFCIKVKDSGIGMTEEMMTEIYKDAYKSTPGTHSEKGLGIGLRLCKHLVQKVGGSLTLQSKPGKGTTVTINV